MFLIWSKKLDDGRRPAVQLSLSSAEMSDIIIIIFSFLKKK